MDQLAYKATKAMVGYKVNSITKNVKEELGFGEDKKKEDSEHERHKRFARHQQGLLYPYVQHCGLTFVRIIIQFDLSIL